MTEKDAESFLAKSQESLPLQNQQQAPGGGGNPSQVGMAGLPLGAHVRDDEQALFLLLQVGSKEK